MTNPLANPDAASLPPRLPDDTPEQFPLPGFIVQSGHDPLLLAALRELARAVAEVLAISRETRQAQQEQAATLHNVSERVSTLGNAMHGVLERLAQTTPPQAPRAKTTPPWDQPALEAQYRAAIADHKWTFDPKTNKPIIPETASYTSLYQAMQATGRDGPATTAQTAIQGNGGGAYAWAADARRLWLQQADFLKSGEAGKRAVLKWLASPTGRAEDGCIPRYLLADRGRLSIADMIGRVPDNSPDPAAAQATGEKLLLAVKARPDLGVGIVHYTPNTPKGVTP